MIGHPYISMEPLMKSLFLLPLLFATTVHAADWSLTWSDEFTTPGRPDPAKWNYESGFIRNHEAQYYTDRPENVRVENGMLIIEGRKEHFANPRYSPTARGMNAQPFADYTSASLITKGKFDFTYGRIEARAKLPTGPGTWPAIWTLGTDIDKVSWPRCGEIDIMEFLGREGNLIHGTAHWKDADSRHGSQTAAFPLPTAASDFHLYAVEWSPTQLRFFVDTTNYLTVPLDKADANNDNPFHHPQYLILNLALGGDWGKTIAPTTTPAQLLIDYVRIYKSN
jgi:beta-glucanase (GH16 family)